MEQETKVAKAALWYTISNILLRMISFITIPIFTRLLTVGEYGMASNFNAWTSLVYCFSGSCLVTAVIRGRIEFESDYKRFLSAIQALSMVWCGVCAAILIAGMRLFSGWMHLEPICIVVMLLYLFVYPSQEFIQQSLKFDYRYKENIGITVFYTIGIVICSVILILLLPTNKAMGRILGSVLPTILIGTVLAVQIYKRGKTYFDRTYWKYAWKLSLPMIPHNLSMIVLGQLDRVMILSICGEAAAGKYSLAYGYGILLAVITNGINNAIQPRFYELLEKKEEKSLKVLGYKVMGIAAAVSAMLIAAGPMMLRILGTEEYMEARFVIYPVVAATLMQFFYQIFSVVEIYQKKTRYMAIGSVLAAVTNVLLNLWLIPIYGYVIAAYTTLFSYFLLMVFHFFIARKAYAKKIFGIPQVGGFCLALLVIGKLLEQLLY